MSVHLLGLREVGESHPRQPRRGGARRHAPAQRFGGVGLPRMDQRTPPSARRPRRWGRPRPRAAAGPRYRPSAKAPIAPRLPSDSTTDSGPMARIRSAASRYCVRVSSVRAEQPLGLLLVGRHHRRASLRCPRAARRRRRAAGSSPSFCAPSRSACRRSAEGTPGGRLPHSISHARHRDASRTAFSTRASFGLCQRRTRFVQIDREAMLVRDREVGADFRSEWAPPRDLMPQPRSSLPDVCRNRRRR